MDFETLHDVLVAYHFLQGKIPAEKHLLEHGPDKGKREALAMFPDAASTLESIKTDRLRDLGIQVVSALRRIALPVWCVWDWGKEHDEGDTIVFDIADDGQVVFEEGYGFEFGQENLTAVSAYSYSPDGSPL